MLLQNGAKVCKQWLTLFSRCPKAYHQQFLTLTDTLSLSYQTCKLWQTFEILFPAGCLHWTGQGWNISTPSFSLQPAFVTRFARLYPTCAAGGTANKLDGMIKLLEMYIQGWILNVQYDVGVPYQQSFCGHHTRNLRIILKDFIGHTGDWIIPTLFWKWSQQLNLLTTRRRVLLPCSPLSARILWKYIFENYRIARLSFLENEEEMCKLKQDLGRRSTLSNVSRGSLFLWGDDHHQKTLTWHLGGGMPICQEYGERQNTENWKEYPGNL